MNRQATEKNPLFGRLRFHTFRTRSQCAHGPQAWPWWRWVAFRVSHLTTYLPTTGRALWVYTRWGAFALDIVVDRRGMTSPE